jgi:hypothetical protein
VAAAQKKPKKATGARNDARPNGKAWKKGKSPETRAAEVKKRQKRVQS